MKTTPGNFSPRETGGGGAILFTHASPTGSTDSFKSEDPFIIAVSRPTRLCLGCMSLCFWMGFYLRLLVLASGDIESNPDPITNGQETQLISIFSIVPGLEKGQGAILGELRTLKELLTRTNSTVAGLYPRHHQPMSWEVIVLDYLLGLLLRKQKLSFRYHL